jgi:DNA-binding transcriptional LysR family regulator
MDMADPIVPVHGEQLSLVAPRLRQFAMVARAQHVTRAADQLGLAQSTLSRNIARLEADLGVALFVRAGRAVRLTRPGRQLLSHVERALVALSDGLEELSAEVHPDRGRVAFAFLTSLGARAVPVILRDFRSRQPDVRFTLVQDSHDTMLAKLRAGTVDLCLTSPLPDEPDLRARRLDQQRLCLVVPRGHRLAGRRRVRLAEAADEEFVGLEHGFGLRRITDEWCRQAGFEPRLAFEGEEIDTVLGLAAAGLGVALLPAGLTGTFEHDLVELAVTAPPTTRTIALVWLADRTLPPPVEAFQTTVLGYRGRLLSAR